MEPALSNTYDDSPPRDEAMEYIAGSLASRMQYGLDKEDMTQVELARRVGVTKGAVSNWVLGRTASIKPALAYKVAKALRVSPQWLMTGRGDTQNNAGEVSIEISEEALQFDEAFSRGSEEKRALLKAIAYAVTHCDELGSDEEEKESDDGPPGAKLLARVFEILDTEEFKRRFAVLPVSLKGMLVAAIAAKLRAMDEGGDLDIEQTKMMIQGMMEMFQGMPE